MRMTTHVLIHRIFKIRSELQEIYLNQVIQTFAISLIGIFIPIYLLNLGYSLNAVLFYGLLALGTLGVLSPVSAKVASRIGLKHTILVRMPVSMLFYSLLILMEFSVGIYHIVLLGLIAGLSDSLYWVSLNSEFMKHSDMLHASEETSHLIAFPKLAGIAAPVIGAFVLGSFGFEPLFLVVITLIMLSVIPLFATEDFRDPFTFRFRDLNMTLSKRYAARFFSKGSFVSLEHFIWPIYVYFTMGDFMSVGIASALSGIGIAFFTLFVGKISDRFSRRKLMKAGALGYAFVWFSRLYAHSPLEIFLLSFLGGMFMAVVMVNLFSSFCNDFRKGNILKAIVFREAWLNLGRVFCLFIIILAVSKFQATFILSGLMCLLLVFI